MQGHGGRVCEVRSGLTLAPAAAPMRKTISILAALSLSTLARAQSSDPPALFTRSDAFWAAGFLVGSVALSTADVRLAAFINDSTHRGEGRDRFARNFAKVQEGTLFFGNM